MTETRDETASVTTPRTRRELLASIPWVRLRKTPTTCDAFPSKTPLRYIHGTGAQRAQRPHCTKPAYWHFRALKGSYAESGVYCMAHLLYRGLYGDMLEEMRTRRWLLRHHPNLVTDRPADVCDAGSG